MLLNEMYHQTSNIRHSKSKKNVSRLVLQLSLPHPLKPSVNEDEDLVGAAPTGNASTTYELSTILLPTKDDMSSLVQVVASTKLMASHYLNQWWQELKAIQFFHRDLCNTLWLLLHFVCRKPGWAPNWGCRICIKAIPVDTISHN